LSVASSSVSFSKKSLGQADRGVDQEAAEQEEHPGEELDQPSTQRDEDASEHQRQDDAHQQRELLEVTRHAEPAHDDEEDEQVVDGQRVLGEPAGDELTAVRRAHHPGDPHTEQQRGADVHADRESVLTCAGFVRASAHDEDIESEDGQQHHDGERPGERSDVHSRRPFRADRIGSGGLLHREVPTGPPTAGAVC